MLGVLAAAMFLYEWTTQTNMYTWVGGVSPYTMIRDGKLRCVGPFKHPILAGTFWAGVLPWVMGRWWTQPQQRVRTLLGSWGIVLVIFATASSTPLMGLLVGLGGCAAYSLRNSMGAIRWGVVLALASLHLVMEKPVWEEPEVLWRLQNLFCKEDSRESNRWYEGTRHVSEESEVFCSGF